MKYTVPQLLARAREIAGEHGFTLEELRCRSKVKELAIARKAAYLGVYELCRSPSVTARIFRRDDATIVGVVKAMRVEPQ